MNLFDFTRLSDFVRYFILDIFGGIYTDVDFIYLKDMRPFWLINFVYRWSFSPRLNNAVIGLNYRTEYSDLFNKIKAEST